MQKRTFIFLLLLAGATAYSQTSKHKIIGKYSDNISELIIKPDNTFSLKTTDYIFPYTYDFYQNDGVWTDSGNVLTLNPGKEKRHPDLSLTEKKIGGNDSIQIKINYLTEVYENEILINKVSTDFKMLTLYINSNKNYRNLVHAPVRRICSFAPKVKRQIVVDSSVTIKLPKQSIKKIGIFSYGFDKPVEVKPVNPDANYFEITIVQPLDKERMPRSKKVIVKRNRAYFYEVNNKIPTSGFLVDGLKRVD